MKRDSQITQPEFDHLLEWLSPDRETAGREYEKIHSGLIRFFRFRGCGEPESLADETINRVTRKLSSLTFREDIQTSTYFYSFASKILLEDVRQRIKTTSFDDAERSPFDALAGTHDEYREERFKCLESCLAELPLGERDLVVRYYSEEKSMKAELRKKLALNMNSTIVALHTRVHRLRVSLRACMDKCISKVIP